MSPINLTITEGVSGLLEREPCFTQRNTFMLSERVMPSRQCSDECDLFLVWVQGVAGDWGRSREKR